MICRNSCQKKLPCHKWASKCLFTKFKFYVYSYSVQCPACGIPYRLTYDAFKIQSSKQLFCKLQKGSLTCRFFTTSMRESENSVEHSWDGLEMRCGETIPFGKTIFVKKNAPLFKSKFNEHWVSHIVITSFIVVCLNFAVY